VSSVSSSSGGSVGALIERFVLVALVALGATTVVATSWARDFSTPRVTLLGAERGVSILVTAGTARVLIIEGTNATELGNALSKARHPGLDRLDIAIVSGNAAASRMVSRAIRLLAPRMVIAIGSDTILAANGISPAMVIHRTTEIDLPEGVRITIEVWPSNSGESESVTWSAMIERGGAAVYWVSDREALMQEGLPIKADITVIGRGKPAADTPFPRTRTIAAAGESIDGPDLRAIAAETIGPDTETLRVFAGETLRIALDPEGIRGVTGATIAGSPTAP